MRALLPVLAVAVATAGCAGAAMPTIRVGKIDSEKSCTLYRMTAGRHREAGATDGYAAAYASETSWISYLVRDCADNFASLRISLQAALAASGKLAVVPGAAGGSYVVSGRISDVGGSATTGSAADGGFSASSSSMVVNMDVALRDASGRIVYGGLITKSLEIGSAMETQGLSSGTSRSGQALYTELQHEVALAVARTVAFRIEPLRVTGVSGSRIQLNYGAPLLRLGTMVQVTAPSGAIIRYNVTGAGQGSAQADYYGGAPAGEATPGSTAIVIEQEDPAANGRRFEKTDLPGQP